MLRCKRKRGAEAPRWEMEGQFAATCSLVIPATAGIQYTQAGVYWIARSSPATTVEYAYSAAFTCGMSRWRFMTILFSAPR